MNSSYSINPEITTEPTTFGDKLVWLLKGFIYPIWSRPYYRDAAVKPLGAALIFLMVFAILQSIFSAVSVGINLAQVSREIEEAYLSGEMPDITIESGRATVSGSGKYLIENNRQIIALDTTGEMVEIDTNRYSEGVLLTRDELHVVNEDGYQVMLLSDLNKTFGNPITLDGDSVRGMWSTLALIITLVVLGGGFFFFSLGRFLYLALLGLLVWAVVSLSTPKFDFAKILITGIYANVPTTYLIFLLRKLGASFFGLRGVILFLFWGIALAFILKTSQTEPVLEEGSQDSPGI